MEVESLYSSAQTERILRHASECDEKSCALPREDCATDGEIRGLLLEYHRRYEAAEALLRAAKSVVK